MATTVPHTVDPNGGAGHDYDSLSLWNAGEQGDLTGVRDEIAVAKCQCTGGTADTTAVVINGWITSATQYIKIWTDPAESYRHNGTYPTGNKYALSTGSSSPITVMEDYVYILGLAISQTGGADGINVQGSYFQLGYSIVRTVSSTGSEAIYSNTAGAAEYGKIFNNIFYDHANSAVWIRSSQLGWVFYNNTIVNCDIGLRNDCVAGEYPLAKNNIFKDCTTGATGTWVAGTDYNATDDASIGYTVTGEGNTHDHVSHTFTFAGAADFHLSSVDVGAKDLGVSDPGSGLFSDDIDGETRTGSWDIGADEYVAAVSAISISVSETLNLAEALD